LKQLGLRQTKKEKKSYTTSLMKKQKPKAHKKTQTGVEVQTGAGTQKANDTYTKYLTKQKPKPIQKLKLE
jgi:phosphoribosyl-ATP pyrophosphohydrolase